MDNKKPLIEDILESDEYQEQFNLPYLDEAFNFLRTNASIETREIVHRHNSRRYGAASYNTPIIFDSKYQTQYFDVVFFIDTSSAMYEGGVAYPNTILEAIKKRIVNMKNEFSVIPFADNVFKPVADGERLSQATGQTNIQSLISYLNTNCKTCVNVVITNSNIEIDKTAISPDIKVVYIVGGNVKIDEAYRVNSQMIKM